jgi:hypothetical protein
MAILVEAPSSATMFPDFHSPVIAVGRNCELKRDRGREDHSAQISNEKCAYHFVSLHFPCSLIEARRHADCFIWPALYQPRIRLRRGCGGTGGHEWTQISPTLQLLASVHSS